MLSHLVLALSLLLHTVVCAQKATSIYSEQGVPTGVPIVGDYTGAYRPQLHFSPPKGFMNDPNGMFLDRNGTYHLYYQYNPTALVAGNQHWGHAISDDLYHWVNQPIAIFPSSKEEGIFSGSAVIDVNNTSGFFPNQTNGVVAIYTLNTPEEQTQDIAYSRDGGYSFTKYKGNPVISINSTQFRDPKVLWHSSTSRWVMVVSYAQEYTLGFFTSSNLKSWSHASNFSNAGLLGLQYECPNLVQLPMLNNASALNPLETANFVDLEVPLWLLMISINPGAPLGGSISQYFPGTFNGTHFVPVDGATRFGDFAKDNYAGQFFAEIDPTEPQISIHWASNWQYTQVLPTASEGFRSTMTVPRFNVLANTTRSPYTLISTPYDLSPQYSSAKSLATNSNLTNASLILDYHTLVPSGALSFTLNATNLPASAPAGSLNFTLLSSTTGETLRGGFILDGDSTCFLDRGNTRGFDNVYFTDKFSVTHPLDPNTRQFSMQVVVDRSIVEVFLDGGERSGTAVFFVEGEMDVLAITTGGISESAMVSTEVWGLKSTWNDENKNVTQIMG